VPVLNIVIEEYAHYSKYGKSLNIEKTKLNYEK
jgi:hypothetical protein